MTAIDLNLAQHLSNLLSSIHAAVSCGPHDYQRWTLPRVGQLFDEFNDIEVWIVAGPTSGMLLVLQEWVATKI